MQNGGASDLIKASRRAAGRKAADVSRKLYGPDGSMRGRERHKVKSVGEILARLQARPQ